METLPIEANFTIGSIVARHYRTADVFKKYKIDFCCKGNRLLSDVCKEKNIDQGKLETELALASLDKHQKDAESLSNTSLSDLATYIEKTHHTYVREQAPLLQEYLNKIARVHGDNHPELREVKTLFEQCAQELSYHMHKEEVVLFPSIKRLEAYKNDRKQPEDFFFGKFANPIGMMMEEHAAEGERLEKISALTNNFTPPEDACTTYRVAFLKLDEFVNDLHTHIHLENNILFPATEQLESDIFS
jgi:regulator of cell morphogenesis and NO signaling